MVAKPETLNEAHRFQAGGPFCPKCGKGTWQCTGPPFDFDGKDHNQAGCAYCGWKGEVWQCTKAGLNEAQCPDGGILRECYKDPEWGQVNIRTLPPGAVTQPHRHPHTWELWCLLSGQLQVHLEFEGLHRMVGGSVLAVPQGWGHWVKNDGPELAVLICRRDTIYNPDDPDKEPWEPA